MGGQIVAGQDLFGRNINLQAEMDAFIFGSGFENPKGRDIIYRRMRVDSNGNPMRCVCVSSTSDEPDKDTYCPYCLGSKYYWDEEYVKAYWFRPGADDNLNFYFNYSAKPSSIDEIIIVAFDDDGKVISPINRISIFNIMSATQLREEYGQLSFFKVVAAPINRRYLGP